MIDFLFEYLPTNRCRVGKLSPLVEKASLFEPRFHGGEARILCGPWLEVVEEVGKHIATG
jgi:hypothetical protein